MFDNWGFAALWAIMRRLFSNPLTTFVYSILSEWYLIIIVGSLIVTYWVFKGLKDVGVIDKAQTILVRGIEESKGIAKNCTPRIVNLADFWNCLSDPASIRYAPTSDEQKLERDVKSGLDSVPVIPGHE
jgi:hypothetical protein